MRLPQSIRLPGGTRRRSPGVSPAVFLAHLPDLQPWSLMDMDFANGCPLVRPYLPRIRLLFVGSRFRSTLPSDGPSRFRPCASLVLHLHQVAQGTFTPRLPDMPGTQEGAACGGACWASLTAAGRSTLGMSGRDEETAPSTGPGNGVLPHFACSRDRNVFSKLLIDLAILEVLRERLLRETG